MISTRVRDNAVPDDGAVGAVVLSGPFRRYVDKYLFRVPMEQGAQVGFERELNDRVLLGLGAIVVWSALDSAKFWSAIATRGGDVGAPYTWMFCAAMVPLVVRGA